MKKTAVISGDELYRYSLERWWDYSLGTLVFIMLNPSTADEDKDDNTIRRCIWFAKNLKFGSIRVVNLFAYRATNPKDLKTSSAPMGPENDYYLKSCIRSKNDKIILAFGNHGKFKNQHDYVIKLLRKNAAPDLYCFGKTSSGMPKHPLYLSKKSELVEY